VIHTAKASGRELWVEGRGGVRMSTRDGRTGPCAMSCCWFAEAYLRKRGEAVRETCDGQGVVLWRYYWGWGNARPSSPPWPSQPGRGTFASFCGGSLAPAHRNAGQETEDQGVVDDRPPSTSDFDGPPAPAELLFLLAWVSSVWDSSLIADEPPCSARCDLHVSHSCLHVWLV
jgi:hypothetical protein